MSLLCVLYLQHYSVENVLQDRLLKLTSFDDLTGLLAQYTS